MVTLTTLTSNTAQTRLSAGIGRLGLTMPILAGSWSNAGNYDAAAMTLTFNANINAPWRGTLEAAPAGDFRDVAGLPIAGPNAVFRLHPQAAHRLATLAAGRYAGGGPNPRPVPVAMVIRGITYVGPPFRHEPGEIFLNDPGGGGTTPLTGTVSFHDSAGLPICPIAVAAMFADLCTAFPVLRVGVAGLKPITDLNTQPTGLHLVDPHGFALDSDALALLTLGGAAPAAAVLEWPSSASLTPASGVRAGMMSGGRMVSTALTAPAPGGLSRQFVRVVVAELAWHLLGNRSQSPKRGIPADDGLTPSDLLPVVHPNSAVSLHADSLATLAAAIDIAATTLPAQPDGSVDAIGWLVSPVIETAIGAAQPRWPAFTGTLPAGATAATAISDTLPITATWIGTSKDVRLSIPFAGLPLMGHVRAYPRSFQTIGAIGNTPSFVRGDGASAPVIAPAAPTTTIDLLLANPFGLGAGQNQLQSPVIAFDLVAVDRAGKRVVQAFHTLTVAAGPSTVPPDPWGGANPMDGWNPGLKAVSPSSLFAAPKPAPAAAGATVPPTSDPIVKAVRALAQESQPRQGPRLPTMMRFDSIVAAGTRAGTNAPYTWRALLSGARWARESRSALHSLGNPGEPAGPDIHAPGVATDGALAFDLVRHAMKRALPILPLLGIPDDSMPGWLIPLLTSDFAPPAEAAAAAPGAPSYSAAMLTTVAAYCDTPELTLIEEPGGPLTLQEFADRVADKLGVSHQTVTEPAGTTRGLIEMRREEVRARHGSRDAAFALRRALAQASRLIYLEGPAFGPTRYPQFDAPDDPAEPSDPMETPDLLSAIANAMSTRPGLRLLVAVSKESDFAPSRPSWIAQAAKARKIAVNWLGNQFPGRVAVFHPAGFPGRSTQLRTSIAIVDDVFALIGTSHFRRRGHSFDGGVDVALMDDDFSNGSCAGIAAFRQALLAAKLGVAPPATPLTAGMMPSADWDRLADPRGAFDFVAALLKQGGLGHIEPLWAGSDDPTVTADPPRQTDPNGMAGTTATLAIVNVLSALDQT